VRKNLLGFGMIDLQQLVFSYSYEESLFTDINLGMAAGGICGLLGKNGAGKTTMLKIMAGLLFPLGGQCHVLGMKPSERLPAFLREMFFLPEEFYVPHLSPADYVRCYAGFYPRFDQTLWQQHMQEFQLPAHKSLSNLSYGQKKKFLLAFGLATQGKLIILDEPTNGLDIPSKAQFRKLIAQTINDDKLIIISTHQVHDVETLVDSIIILDEGKVILHSDLVSVATKLSFVHEKKLPDTPNLYFEKKLNGYAVVREKDSDIETSVDLELLFNAMLLNKQHMQQLLAKETRYE